MRVRVDDQPGTVHEATGARTGSVVGRLCGHRPRFTTVSAGPAPQDRVDLLMRRSRQRLALSCLIVSIVVAAGPATSSTASERDRQTSVRQRRARAAAQLDALRASDRQLERAVAALDAQVNAQAARAAAAEQAASVAAAQHRDAERRVAELDARIVTLRAAVKQRAVSAYVNPVGDGVGTLLQARDLDELSRKRELLAVVATNGRAEVDALGAAREDQQIVREEAERLARITAQRRDASVRELRQLSANRTAQARLRDGLQARIRSFLAETSALAAEDARLTALIQARQSELARASRGGDVGDIGRISGAGLIWPVRGTVTSEYGTRWGRMHEGIDIAAPTGTPIRAAKAGTVIFVGQQGGYGNMVLVDHGGGFVTAYPHQSRFGTSEGAGVSQGQVIGYVGCSGSCTGPHLHFETRVNGVAQNPRRYLP